MGTMIKLGLLMLSNFGYWEFFRSRCKIGLTFAPAFTVALQFTVLYCAGLLNLLLEAALAVYVLGFVLLAAGLRQEKLGILKPYLHWGYCFLAVSCAVIAMTVKDLEIADPDCIHHWSLVTNTMLRTNRFPNFEDTVITFQSYPLGSAVCIYYFCRFTSAWEDIQLVAQAFVMGCMFLPVFSRIGKNSVLCTVLAAVTYNFLLCYNGSIRDLRVDTLLPLCSAAMFLFFYDAYILSGEERKGPSLYCAIPFLCLCSQIKNSGLFFCLAGVGILLAAKANRSRLPAAIGTCLTPLAACYLWQRHYTYVFARGAMSKHSMNWDWYHYVLSEKTPQDLWTTARRVANYTFSRRELLWVVLWLAALFLISRLLLKDRPKSCVLFPACMAGMYLAYMVGICGMYLLSMPKGESLNMGDIGRYTKTIDIAMYYLVTYYGLSLLSQIKVKQLRTAMGALMVLLMVATWRLSVGSYANILQDPGKYSQDIAKRRSYQQILEEYGVQEGCRYLVLEKTNIYEDSYFFIKYLMNTGEVYTRDVTDSSQLDIAQECQYIFVFDRENAIVNQWLQEHFPQDAGETVIYNFV